MKDSYDRSHKLDEEFAGHHFIDCGCGSQVHLIDTMNMDTVKSECFVLFWYDSEDKILKAVQHMGLNMIGMEQLAEMMARILEGSVASLMGGE